MGMQSLRDLNISGVKWELSENPRKNLGHDNIDSEKSAPVVAHNSQTTPSNIIPPAQLVTMDYIQNCANNTTDAQGLIGAICDLDHPLRQFAKNVVPPHFCTGGAGRLMIITDVPSTDDDDTGHILTGAAGDLMDKMLMAIELSRDDISIVPLVFWRPPGGRAPSREELDMTRPFIQRAVALLQPSVIMTLGTLTATELANTKLPTGHGDVIQTDEYGTIIPIYHPNFLLLKPDTKRDVWAALQKLQNLLKIV